MGIGDWAQSPIPNPQSPIPNNFFLFIYLIYLLNIFFLSSFLFIITKYIIKKNK
ncbi:MAG: hypothetical protein MJ252_19365 [archaeon]|nr:hypothetical protein [archaeon]